MKRSPLIFCVLLACGPGPSYDIDLGETGGETETGDLDVAPHREDVPAGDGDGDPGDGDGDGDPGDGDGDGDPVGDGDPEACDYLGCPCDAGGCGDALVCDLNAQCSTCAPGSPGCPCGDSLSCDVGVCSSGEDTDGTPWSICYPADLLGCAIDPCPGDAYCTDSLGCAWAT